MRTLLGGLAFALAAALGFATAPAAADPPTITAFFKRPAVSQPKLSPSGRYLAVLAAGRDDRIWLAVMDLQDLTTPKIVAGFHDADIGNHHWVNEDRLVFQVSNSPDGSTRIFQPGLWAVDRDGSKYRQLINSDKQWISNSSSLINDRRLEANWRFFATLPDGGDEILVKRLPWSEESESTGVQLVRLDTRTGLTRNLNRGLPDGVIDWTVDWRGEPRAVEALSKGRVKAYLREADGNWKLWYEDGAHERKGFSAYWFGPDGQTLVEASHDGYSALFRLDPKTDKPEKEPLISFKGYDFQGELIFDPVAKRLLGLHFETDAPGSVWLDATMKARQADIDAKLPGAVNRIECERCLDATHLVVTSISDQIPPRYWIYKPADKSIQPLAGTRPDLPLREMGQRDVVRFKARDGLEIPLLVTQPPGKPAPRPTVVLVHGGPYVRGTHWRWEPMAQFLANRGYVVLEPEYRGSTGYGFKHFRAGWKQWGLAMQDDLADTLAWAVKQGWSDPKRACIMGASYGGYAALMGAVTQGDIFKCAVNWVGVTDIGLMSSINWSDMSDEWKNYGMKQLVADPDSDAEQMRKTSPLARAGEIRIPLLMAYGGEDRRVPLKHGSAMKAALRADQPVEWVIYPEEGHGWFNLKTNEDFWGRVERFLARHIGATTKP
ncbi:dipeptidyl aminopeptidase/acylaminoacyl peptidase [Pelomonas saccharophila]|uniref:Dipeptidyl aminopeptidase/acylaminoacyl peptidase n=1 Tax=Roseateles saccharophilus TaxID=304 RepID=A0ABU1YQU9_ROSSA|nr:alpha/beta fold hydrolase [Roseateles saccharophilus]MDR7270590.1 dipeptidyl aminopeptidase/acylaminoacyl peptidase [Roseateles saccharophilus]